MKHVFCLPFFVLLFSLAVSSANAEVTFKFSDQLRSKLEEGGKNSAELTNTLAKRLNKGLKELAKTGHADAKRLFEGNQTIRFICIESDEADRKKIYSDGLYFGIGYDRDGDERGLLKEGGTSIIVVDCEALAKYGLDGVIEADDPKYTAYKTIYESLFLVANTYYDKYGVDEEDFALFGGLPKYFDVQEPGVCVARRFQTRLVGASSKEVNDNEDAEADRKAPEHYVYRVQPERKDGEPHQFDISSSSGQTAPSFQFRIDTRQGEEEGEFTWRLVDSPDGTENLASNDFRFIPGLSRPQTVLRQEVVETPGSIGTSPARQPDDFDPKPPVIPEGDENEEGDETAETPIPKCDPGYVPVEVTRRPGEKEIIVTERPGDKIGTPESTTVTPKPKPVAETVEDPPVYENAKVKQSVLDVALNNSASGTPYASVAIKLPDGDPPLPTVADIPLAVFEQANYIPGVNGGLTDDDGAVPIVSISVDIEPSGNGTDDVPIAGLSPDTEGGAGLQIDDGSGKKKAGEKKKKPTLGILDTAESGIPIEGSETGTKSSPRKETKHDVPAELAKQSTAGVKTYVKPLLPLVVQSKGKKKRTGVKVQTQIGFIHIPGDLKTGNDVEYELVIQLDPAKVTWRSGKARGQFTFNPRKGKKERFSREYVKPFKPRDSVATSEKFTDFLMSEQKLGSILKGGLPKSQLAGTVRFQLEIERCFKIFIRKKGSTDEKKRIVLKEGAYKRAFKGRLVEKAKRGGALSDGDRTGKYGLEDLETDKNGIKPENKTSGSDDGNISFEPADGGINRQTQISFNLAPSKVDRVVLLQQGNQPIPLGYSSSGDVCERDGFQIGNRRVRVFDVNRDKTDDFIADLSGRDGVDAVERDHCRQKEEDPNDPYYSGKGLWGQDFENQWALKRVGFSNEGGAWQAAGEDLQPVTVAIVDSGIDWFHPDLDQERFWINEGEIPENGFDDDDNGYIDDVIGYNFVDGNASPWDKDGHGTFVAGVIAAATNNDVGISGINPAANVMVLKALDSFGQGHASMVAEAVTYATDNGARIINLSLAGPEPTAVERAAIDYARDKDVIVVVAAGNQGKNVDGFSPSGLPGVITVTASDRRDKRAGFSNYGPGVDIAAPGVDILSLRARNTDLLALIRGVTYERGNGITAPDRAYFRATGTSFAAPIVAGTLSLLLSADPDRTAEEAIRMVLHSTRDIETPGIDNFTGYGLLDAAAALSADPEFFAEARLDGVKVVKTGSGPALRVIGTIDADVFEGASIAIGKGKAPDTWQRLSVDFTQTVRSGPIVDIPAQFFRGAKDWTIRLITRHANGTEREARYTVTLG